jgi:hypothetical protein
LNQPFRRVYLCFIKTNQSLQKTKAMKTKNIFAAVSIMLLFLGTALFAGNKVPGSNSGNMTEGIRFDVVVHMDNETNGNNVYLIQLLDEHGRAVGPAKTYVKGVSVYTFYEWGPKTGARIARMILSPVADHNAGLPNLFCRPDVIFGTFENRKVYTLDLFPSFTPPARD